MARCEDIVVQRSKAAPFEAIRPLIGREAEMMNANQTFDLSDAEIGGRAKLDLARSRGIHSAHPRGQPGNPPLRKGQRR